MKHTAGPWGIQKPQGFVHHDKQGDRLIYSEKTKEHVAETFQYRELDYADIETALANARLIASAPELLTALNKIRSMQPTIHALPGTLVDFAKEVCNLAREAIAKATE